MSQSSDNPPASAARTTVMIVDEAIAFGGSIVSTANLIRGLDREHFDAVFVSSTSEAIIHSKLKEAADHTPVYIFHRALDYRRLGRIRSHFRSWPGPLRKLANALLYLLQLLVNAPYIFSLLRVVRRHGVDLVQINNGYSDEIFYAAWLARLPMVMYFRGYSRQGSVQRRLIQPRIGAFVSVSEFIRRESVADGVPPERSHVATPPVIPDAVAAADLAALRAEHGIGPDTPTAGIFGRIVDWKGQREAVLALADVRDTLPDVRLFVVGDVSDGDEGYLHALKALIDEHGLREHVVFTGYRDNVQDYYALVDVVVHASIWAEPSGRVIFEGMSYGTPVIGSCHGGPREFIDDGVDGYIVDPRDPPQIAEKLVTLLSDDALRTRMGELGREKICERFSKENYARQMQGIYDQVLRGG